MSRSSPPVQAFADGLPPAYREAYSEEEIASHSRIAAERQGSVELGVFATRGDLTGVCVVADDCPGLLSRLSEAFLVCSLDIVDADAFTRHTDTGAEAIDIFWVREGKACGAADLTHHDLLKIRSTMLGLVDGSLQPADPLALIGPEVTSSNSRVRFIEDDNGALCTLEIETDDRSGLLLSLSRALTAQQVHIVRSEVKTRAGRVVDRFTITELNGNPVRVERRLEIQVAILSAAEPAKRLSTPAPPNLDGV